MRARELLIRGAASVGLLVASAAPLAAMGVVTHAGLALQTRTITGTIADSVSKEPVSAGQIVVAGTTNGTLVRGDGRFQLNVPAGPVTLQVRSLGYKPARIQVGAEQNTVEVLLARDYFRLEEVVVSGQATGIEKKNLATSVGTVDAEQLSEVPAASIERALAGKITGARITENSGAPGGGSIVRIRGVTTIIGAFTPLYVVDGVIVSDVQLPTGTNFLADAIRGRLAPTVDNQDNGANRIADLNPYDIEKVEVLKGAAASAIYGSKASNGVVLITTKRGQTGGVQFDVTQRFGVSQLSHKRGLRCFKSVDEAVAVFGEVARESFQPRCLDWEEMLYGKDAKSYETALTMRGGSDVTRFFASLLNKQDGGIMPKTDAGKKSLRLNVDQNVGSRMTLGLSSEYVLTVRNPGITQNENNGLAIPAALGYGGASWLDLRKQADGTYPRHPLIPNNPFQTADLFRNREDVSRGILSARLQAELWNTNSHTLRFSANGGGDQFTQKNKVVAPPNLYALEGIGLPGSSVLSYAQNRNLNLSANVVHEYRFGGGTATGQVGVQWEAVDFDASYTLTQGLIGGLSNIDRGLAVRVEQNRQRVRDQGFFVQEEVLLLDERLLFTLGLRADRSTNNADVKKLFYYPKASLSYRMPRLASFVDELKLRVALGQSGNQPRYGDKFTELTATNLSGEVPTSQIFGIAAASDLRPERQRELEGGFDATLFNSRINLEVTGYEKRISDLLQRRTLAPGTGFTTLIFNGGGLRTRGLELAANVVAYEGPRWNWRTRASYTMNRCKITDLPVAAYGSTAFLNGNTFGRIFTEVGKSCTQITGNDTLPDGSTVPNVYIADANPDYNWSWSHDFGFGPFHLSGLLDGQKGGNIVNVTMFLYDLIGVSPDMLVPRKKGELTGTQRAQALGRTARTYIQDISYVKLREITLAYDVPRSLVERFGARARGARLTLSGRNLHTWTDYQSTADPEVNQVSRSAAGGVPWDLWAYPPSRTFWLGIDLKF
jgi:TonB-linked SusC/RagA family outer membrane protein